MSASNADLCKNDACTSCQSTKDKSAYWTPALYFLHSNGSSAIVPQVGGMLAYYLMYLDDVKPFPEGFSMIAGQPKVRNFTGSFPDEPLSSWPQDSTGTAQQTWLRQRALGFNCLNYQRAAEPSLYRHEMPSKEYIDANCADGIRMELAFPSCGNGEKDSDDHRSHMAYPSLVKEGNCPRGYDVHYPFLFFETIWGTNYFHGQDGQFVLSYGDPVGTGYHGDFMMGWESEEFLGQVIRECGARDGTGKVEDCPPLAADLQTEDEMKKCAFRMPVELESENSADSPDGIPGAVPVQPGPEEAQPYSIPGRKTTAAAKETATAQASIVAASAVDDKKGHHNKGHHVQAAADPTPSDPTPSAANPSADHVESASCSTITQGGKVIHLFVEEKTVFVTVTDTPQATAQAQSGNSHHAHAAAAGPVYRRHMHHGSHGRRF